MVNSEPLNKTKQASCNGHSFEQTTGDLKYKEPRGIILTALAGRRIRQFVSLHTYYFVDSDAFKRKELLTVEQIDLDISQR